MKGLMDSAAVLFWFSVFMILYPYALYPALLRFLSLFRRGPARLRPGSGRDSGLPKVSLLISAYNEESVIEEKIINSLSLDYPKDLLEIIVVSDASTDRTDEIVKRYERRGIDLLRAGKRQGKTACLNNAVAQARGQVLVFSDANSLYDGNAVRNLAAGFQDERTGFVSGVTRYSPGGHAGMSQGIGFYSRLEKFTKSMESAFGACIGADGAIFAIRRELYRPLKAADINDLVIPLSVIRQGFKGVLAEHAYCMEAASVEAKSEFNRQVRITARTLRALLNNRDLLNPLRYPFFSFALFSHKCARFLAPFFLLLAAISALPLLLAPGTGLWTLLYFSCVCGALLVPGTSRGKHLKWIAGLASLLRDFTSVNAAMLVGWLKFMKGETFTTWAPTQR
jgi:cellulose synthase/poly-beta-1,6-N-acetylglucosamine synthase-like glycosyltransferase